MDERVRWTMVRRTLIAGIVLAVVVAVGALAPQAEARRRNKGLVRPIDAPEVDRQAVVDGNTAFALDLYQQLRTEDGNVFFSPFSISDALAMTLAGARGQTAQELADALHLNLDAAALHPAFQSVLAEMRPRRGDRFKLKVANALWGQQDFDFQQEFVDLARRHYGARMAQVDFRNKLDRTIRVINRWVSRKTQRRIKEVVDAGTVNTQTVLVLTNAVYFKGKWAQPFAKRDTETAPFLLAEGGQASAPLMTVEAKIPFLDGDGFKVADLPYKGDTLSMLVVVPDAPDGLSALEHALDPQTLAEWINGLEEQTVDVFLPRFEIRSKFSLKKVLGALGVQQAFLPGVADLSGIGASPGDLFIGVVKHEAFVKVGEQGTVAVAVTAVGARSTSLPPEPPKFRADRPFLFLIRHRPTGSILFLGRVTNPTL